MIVILLLAQFLLAALVVTIAYYRLYGPAKRASKTRPKLILVSEPMTKPQDQEEYLEARRQILGH